MRKHILLAAAATAVIALSAPAYAQDNHDGADGRSSLEVDLRYANEIDTSIVTDIDYTKDVTLRGTVRLDGRIDVDASAVAVNDIKQISAGNDVLFREENELNGENGFVSPVFGGGFSESGQDPNDNRTDGVFQGQIRVGFFAPIINNAGTGDINAAGNLGVNVAAGYYNMQMNSASLAVSTFEGPVGDSGRDREGGWAEASTTALQASLGNTYAGASDDELPEDDEEAGGGGNNFRDRNTAATGAIGGTGNVGVNVAAGAFNQQANLLTIAVVTDGSLAEANAGLIQTADFNFAELQDSINNASTGPITTTGNAGVNVAAGVGNQQMNSLTIATSTAGAGSSPTPPDNPGDPS